MAITPNKKNPTRNNTFPKGEHNRNAPYEDEVNESRVLSERGKNASETVSPTEDGLAYEGEMISELASIGREQPGNIDSMTPEADQSPFYGQGFEPTGGSDAGIQRTPRKDPPEPSVG